MATCSSASMAWPSIMVLRGTTVVVGRTVLKCTWNENFGSVLERLGGGFSNELVSSVLISSNERFVEPTHTVPLDAPIKLLEMYGCYYICYKLVEDTTNVSVASDSRNVATVLMQSARQLVQPSIITPTLSSDQLRGDHSLRNDIVRYLQEMNVGWSPTTVSTTILTHIIKNLTKGKKHYISVEPV